MLFQVYSEGNHYQVLNDIIENSADGRALKRSDELIRSRGGNLKSKKATIGWKFEFEWKDGTLRWILLKGLKPSNPVEISEYVVANNIEYEPAFKWWVKDVICKWEKIISKVKSQYWITTNKFGIQVTHTVDEAYKIDQQRGNIFWEKYIEKEMANVRFALEV